MKEKGSQKSMQEILKGELLVLEKEVGETPLACMERWRQERIAGCSELDAGDAVEAYRTVKMTYAGRLDPMASGVLLALTGDRVHEKESFLKLPKTYTCTAILGVETDTYDVLGIPTGKGAHADESGRSEPVSLGEVEEALGSFVGTFVQKYPPYSSKTVGGKQLHAISREGGLDELDAGDYPSQQVAVLSVDDISIGDISVAGPKGLVAQIVESVQKVVGDFRQAETVEAWKAYESVGSEKNQTVTFTISVSGGTYIRGIVHDIGQQLGVGACIWMLHRTCVGEYRAVSGMDN